MYTFKVVKKSFTIKIFLILTCSILAIILFYWLLNSLILEKYYINRKEDSLIQAYLTINQDYNNNVADIELELEKIDKNKNINITIKTEDQQELIYNSSFPREQSPPKAEAPPEPEDKKGNRFDGLAKDVLNMEKREVLENTDEYLIEKLYDSRLNSAHIVLTSQLDNGYYLFLRTPLQSISENVKISNQFLIISGVIVGFISSLIMYFISKNITKPILELSSIAEEMAEFNFSKKYNVVSQDEIGILGQSINILSEQLEQKISELKSANISLQRDLEQKLKIDEMRKDFLSNISHELKTPIALIQGYAEGLKDNIITDEESREYYIDVILDEADKMNNMVKKLLTLNQLEFGKDIINVRRFDIVEMIKCLINKSEVLTVPKNITVNFKYNKSVYVWADEFMIEEVFMNYMTNAANHTTGDKIINVELQVTQNIVRILVSNTGSHIPENELDKVWISFYKVDKARTREYGGSGIGLSVVKAAMDLHKQNYGVYNTDTGITFWFELDCS